MAAIGKKLRGLEDGRVAFNCPGCGSIHALNVSKEGRPRWGYNGNPDAPTFTPSILVTWDFGPAREKKCCHSFVTDGRIRFLGDCTHALAGQTVDLPDVSGGTDG